jgi:hypothetical protein
MVFWLNAVYAGPRSEFTTLLEPLLTAFPPTSQNVSEVSWNNLTKVAFFGSESRVPDPCAVKNLSDNIYGGAIQTWDVPTFERLFADLAAFFDKYLAARGTVFFIEFFSKEKSMSVPDDATAYPWRNVTAHLLVDVSSVLSNPPTSISHVPNTPYLVSG